MRGDQRGLLQFWWTIHFISHEIRGVCFFLHKPPGNAAWIHTPPVLSKMGTSSSASSSSSSSSSSSASTSSSPFQTFPMFSGSNQQWMLKGCVSTAWFPNIFAAQAARTISNMPKAWYLRKVQRSLGTCLSTKSSKFKRCLHLHIHTPCTCMYFPCAKLAIDALKNEIRTATFTDTITKKKADISNSKTINQMCVQTHVSSPTLPEQWLRI